jgi:hypothetical protein
MYPLTLQFLNFRISRVNILGAFPLALSSNNPFTASRLHAHRWYCPTILSLEFALYRSKYNSNCKPVRAILWTTVRLQCELRFKREWKLNRHLRTRTAIQVRGEVEQTFDKRHSRFHLSVPPTFVTLAVSPPSMLFCSSLRGDTTWSSLRETPMSI